MGNELKMVNDFVNTYNTNVSTVIANLVSGSIFGKKRVSIS
jgi:hypothetical protein